MRACAMFHNDARSSTVLHVSFPVGLFSSVTAGAESSSGSKKAAGHFCTVLVSIRTMWKG
jgi:hypothetical protein